MWWHLQPWLSLFSHVVIVFISLCFHSTHSGFSFYCWFYFFLLQLSPVVAESVLAFAHLKQSALVCSGCGLLKFLVVEFCSTRLLHEILCISEFYCDLTMCDLPFQSFIAKYEVYLSDLGFCFSSERVMNSGDFVLILFCCRALHSSKVLNVTRSWILDFDSPTALLLLMLISVHRKHRYM